MTWRELLSILTEWQAEQPDKVEFDDDPMFEGWVWRVKISHPKYGNDKVTESWVEIIDSEGWYAPEALLVLTTVIRSAKPQCLVKFEQLIKDCNFTGVA